MGKGKCGEGKRGKRRGEIGREEMERGRGTVEKGRVRTRAKGGKGKGVRNTKKE